MRKAVIACGVVSIIVLSQFARAQNDNNAYLDNIRQQIAASNAKAAAFAWKQNNLNKAATQQQLELDIAKNLPSHAASSVQSAQPMSQIETYTPPPQVVSPITSPQNSTPDDQAPTQTNIFVSPQQGSQKSTPSQNLYR